MQKSVGRRGFIIRNWVSMGKINKRCRETIKSRSACFRSPCPVIIRNTCSYSVMRGTGRSKGTIRSIITCLRRATITSICVTFPGKLLRSCRNLISLTFFVGIRNSPASKEWSPRNEFGNNT